MTLSHYAFPIYNINNNGTNVRSHWPHSSTTTNMGPPLWAHVWRNSPTGAPEILCSLKGMGTLSDQRTNRQSKNILPAVVVITGAEASWEWIYSWYAHTGMNYIYIVSVWHMGRWWKGNVWWTLIDCCFTHFDANHQGSTSKRLYNLVFIIHILHTWHLHPWNFINSRSKIKHESTFYFNCDLACGGL